MVSGVDFGLNGARLTALRNGALWWPDERVLVVTDLHFGKSERIARRGGYLLPPYDSRDTLHRLAETVAALAPGTVICLGDSFDDLDAVAGLVDQDLRNLAALMSGRRWVWITGNHDPGPVDLGGTWRAAYARGPLEFRHIADPSAPPGEVSGHYHPKVRITASGRGVSRPAFLFDARRLILPAFGAYTGGLRHDDPALAGLFTPGTTRAVLTGAKALLCPL